MSQSSEALDDDETVEPGDRETAESSEQETAESSDQCCGGYEAIPETVVTEDVRLLSAMGNDTRYELLRLIGAEEDGVCVCELERAVGVSQSAVSQALSRLYEAGLVSRRKEGTWRYYEATASADRLLNALDEIRTDE